VKLLYRAAYRLGVKPWDSGLPPPELKAVVEGPEALPPGRALDLGCGTGTNAVYLAKRGWLVTGVDFVARALALARKRAAQAGVSPRFLQGDVTRLTELGVGEGHSLLLDLGCFHSIPLDRRDAYAVGVTRAASPGATFLLFGFAPEQIKVGPRGTSRDELELRFTGWEVTAADRGTDRIKTYWYRLRRR
jgi:SAM-dependent methyltransferase